MNALYLMSAEVGSPFSVGLCGHRSMVRAETTSSAFLPDGL